MDQFRPLLYFLKECNSTRDVIVEPDFINPDDLVLLKGAIQVPRTAEFIWLYEKLTAFCREVNAVFYQFQISGFACDLRRISEDDKWILSIEKGINSTNKLNILLCTGTGVLYMNHGEYQVDLAPGTVVVFPAYLWWKASGDVLACHLSGNHFM
jgi:hypothetical protein